jgi:lambda family phage portal protein
MASSLLKNDPEMQDLIGITPSNKLPLVKSLLPTGGSEFSAMVGGAYEGADLRNREMAMWDPSRGSADDDIIGGKSTMDARSRDLMRNDAYARSALENRKDSVVGDLFALNSEPSTPILQAQDKRMDDKWSEEFQNEVETLFTLWAESANNWVDASRHNNFTEQVRLVVGLEMMTGESLTSAEWIQGADRPFNTAFQMIDTDRLMDPPIIGTRKYLRGGVQKNFRGEPLGYWVRRHHPNDINSMLANDFKYTPRVKSTGRVQMIHIFEQTRPDQTRGVGAMTAALKETRLGSQFRDIMLQNAIVNATYAATIESEMDPAKVFEALGGGKGNDDWGTTVSEYGAGFLGAVNDYQKNAKNTTLNGVRIPHLFPGTKLNLHAPGQGGPLGTDFEKSILRYLAANFGMSYEQLSRDFSETNYSSLRGALNEVHKHMKARKRAVADKYANHVFMLFLEEAIAKGAISSMPSGGGPSFWEGLNREAYSNCSWIGASRGQIDELKETQASVLKVKYGLSTRAEELAKQGKDWRVTFKQIKREEAKAEELGISFVEDDKMMNASTGAPREKEGSEDDGSNATKNSKD